MSRNRRLWTVLAGIGIVAAGAVTAPARAADFAPPPTYRAGDYGDGQVLSINPPRRERAGQRGPADRVRGDRAAPGSQ